MLRSTAIADSDHRDLWVIVLAGGEGTRLRPLVSRLYGDTRPKQYAALLDSRTLLRHTLDRAQLLVPPERTVVVTMQSHLHFVTSDLRDGRAPRLLPQPRDLGTAAGVLLPAHWIAARDASAAVAVLPSDHYVSDEAALRAHVMDVAAFVSEHPEWIVLLGADPTEADTEYGWIETGEPLDWPGHGPLHAIRRFVEKPDPEAAMALLARGALWNTFVLVATAATLIAAGRTCIPRLHERLSRIASYTGTAEEAWAIRQAYALAPRANFSRSVLETWPGPLAVARLSDVTWCDLGTPSRVARVMATL